MTLEVEVQLKAEIANLKEFLTERDRRYEERFKSAEWAYRDGLGNLEKATRVAFEASKEAILKAENSQRLYNERSNEFRDSLDDANKNNLSRVEAVSKFANYDEKIEDVKKQINEIRLANSNSTGKSSGISASWAVGVTIIVLALSIASMIISLVR